MSHTDATVIEGGTVVCPNRSIQDGTVRFGDGRITAIGGTTAAATTVDATGQYVLPGLVDLHGDDIERHLFPRSGERVDPAVALDRCDVATVGAGVTTKCHALAFEEAPDDERSVELAGDIADRIREYDGAVDHRLHLRCELTNDAAVDAVTAQIQRGAALASLVTHVPGAGQFPDRAALADRYRDNGTVTELDVQRLQERRTGVPRGRLNRAAERVVAAAQRAGVPVASHDDEDAAAVERASELGVEVAEYPLSMAAARRADALAMTVAMGAPNLVRGGSLWDGPAASEAIQAGLVDVLCSDFRPQAMLEAVFVETDEPLHRRVRRVSTVPADVLGLSNRGRLVPGARADIVVVDPEPVPSVTRAFVDGREVFRVDRP
jgi:alpha-D-ribose 1-methylphosphonate 5-triphosphate diphosphatase